MDDLFMNLLEHRERIRLLLRILWQEGIEQDGPVEVNDRGVLAAARLGLAVSVDGEGEDLSDEP